MLRSSLLLPGLLLAGGAAFAQNTPYVAAGTPAPGLGTLSQRTTPGVAYGYAYPGTDIAYRSSQPGYYGMNRMLIQGGGQYAVSPRLTLTGSAWKDLTPAGYQVNPYAGFGGNLGSGVNLRADYHITENFSVSGGLRMSNGTSGYPGYSPMYSPGMPFGY